MDITNLTISNFMTISEADLSLQDKGLVLIRGVNHDDSSTKSNGAGKSSVADALSWCLFGVTARGESGDSVVNRVVGKDCKVQVHVREDDTIYEISRHRKHSKEKNRLTVWKFNTTGPGEDLTLGTDKLTQEVVERIIGCSYDVFSTAIYAGQEKMPNLPAMTDKVLKEIVEEAAGIKMLQACADEARGRATALGGQVENLTTRVASQADRATQLQKLLTDSETRVAEWSTTQAAKIKERSKELREQMINAKTAIAQIKELQEERQKLKDAVDTIQKSIAGFASEQDELKRHQAAFAKADAELIAVKSKLSVAAGDLKRRKSAFDAAGARVGTPCTECGKAIEEHDVSSVIDACKSQLESAAKLYKTLKSAVETAESHAQELKKRRDDFASGMTDLSEASDQVISLKEQEMMVIMKINKHKEVVETAKRAQSELEALKAEENPHVGQTEKLRENLKEAQTKLEEWTQELTARSEELLKAKQVVEVFAPTGVRGAILDEVTPYLNARTSHYLSTLSDGNLTAVWNTLKENAKGELKEKFNIEVTNAKGGDSFGLLSGGEKRKVRLACALALQDMVASRATKPIRIFIADEIDDALDEAGLERLTTILDEKARERGTVLVISHNSLDDWIRDAATVEKSGGLSTISGALCI